MTNSWKRLTSFGDGRGPNATTKDEDYKFYTIDEYKAATEALQKNKEGKQVILYTTDPVQQDAYVQACAAKGYKVIKMETLVDSAFINNMEMKWENVHFTVLIQYCRQHYR